MLSLPSPPSIVSSLRLSSRPVNVSFPAPPTSVPPPIRRSLPPLPTKESFHPAPCSVSSCSLPTIVLPQGLPQTSSMSLCTLSSPYGPSPHWSSSVILKLPA